MRDQNDPNDEFGSHDCHQAALVTQEEEYRARSTTVDCRDLEVGVVHGNSGTEITLTNTVGGVVLVRICVAHDARIADVATLDKLYWALSNAILDVHAQSEVQV